MRFSPALTAALLLVGHLPPFTRAQTGAPKQHPGSQKTIQVQVRLVPVDVIVTDANGHPVTDLKQEDFQVFENGQRQEIRHFIAQTFTAAAPDTSQRAALQAAPNVELVPQSGRTFLILMGRGRIDRPFKSVDALTQFVRDDLLPQDRVAVFAYNRATNFTTDHEHVAQVLERYKEISEDIESRMESIFSGLAAIYGSHQMPKSFQTKIDRIFAASEGSGSRQPIPGRVSDSRMMAKDADRTTETLFRQAAAEDAGDALRLSLMQFDILSANAITDLEFSDYAAGFASTQQDMQNIFTCIDYLRYMEGEKHLVYVTPDGLFLPRTDYDDNIAAYASDARVVIDSIQTGGIPPVSSWDRSFAIQSLRNISQQTGGSASIYQHAEKGLAHLNETTRAQYLLGYYPKDENWDGKYRHIEVKVNRPGVKVSFRHGYFASETRPLLNREELLSYSRITAAGAYTSEMSDVPFQTRAAVVGDRGRSQQIKVDFLVLPQNISMSTVDGRHVGKLRVTIYYADDAGNYLGDVWKAADLNLREETYQQYLQSGIPFSIMVPLQARRQILKIVVYDTRSDKVGSKLLKVK
jgi:VWFA-related protein